MALNPVAYTENLVKSFLRHQLTASTCTARMSSRSAASARNAFAVCAVAVEKTLAHCRCVRGHTSSTWHRPSRVWALPPHARAHRPELLERVAGDVRRDVVELRADVLVAPPPPAPRRTGTAAPCACGPPRRGCGPPSPRQRALRVPRRKLHRQRHLSRPRPLPPQRQHPRLIRPRAARPAAARLHHFYARKSVQMDHFYAPKGA